MNNIYVQRTIGRLVNTFVFFMIIAAAFVLISERSSEAASVVQQKFRSPDLAFDVMTAIIKNGNAKQITAIFGAKGKDIFPADEEANAKAREKFVQAYEEKHRLENMGLNKVILHVGENDWPWPVPLVKAGNFWRFDTEAGIKEINARRIGKNEVAAVQVCLAYVDAQQEYARENQTDGIGEYAQQMVSDQGKKNGLCWDVKDGDKPSLLGPLIAGACPVEVTRVSVGGNGLSPYHGYFYKILKSQGKDAPGGAYDYLVDGKMIGGFAFIAYPALYGSSGIMTFIVNKDGIVYEKDLGKDTEKIAGSMDSYNPDNTWKKVD